MSKSLCMYQGDPSGNVPRALLIRCEAFLKDSKTAFLFEIGSVQTLPTPLLGLKNSHLNSPSGNFDISLVPPSIMADLLLAVLVSAEMSASRVRVEFLSSRRPANILNKRILYQLIKKARHFENKPFLQLTKIGVGKVCAGPILEIKVVLEPQKNASQRIKSSRETFLDGSP